MSPSSLAAHPRILLIDDDRPIRAALHDKLTKSGIDVTEATDGMLGLVSATSKDYDLVLLDIFMPGISGLEVLRRLRKDPIHGKVPVLVMTNLAEQDPQVEQVRRIGVEDVVIKADYPLKDLVEKIKGLVADKTRTATK